MCNLNFNQCNGGSYYPCPIDTCRSKYLSFLNARTTTIINPTIAPAWSYSNFIVPQTVWAGSILGVREQASSGFAINDNIDGTFILNRGTYQVEYNLNGIVPDSSQLSVGAVLDGLIIEESKSISNATSGDVVDLSGRAVFTVTEEQSVLALVNIGQENAIFNRAVFTINKIK